MEKQQTGEFLILTVCFTEMRQVGSSRGAVTAYPRQLESLIRLAEAHSRMRLSSKVENVDVEEARRYVKLGLEIALTCKSLEVIKEGGWGWYSG